MLAFTTDKKNPPMKSGSRIYQIAKTLNTKARGKLMAKPFLLLKRERKSETLNTHLYNAYKGEMIVTCLAHTTLHRRNNSDLSNTHSYNPSQQEQ